VGGEAAPDFIVVFVFQVFQPLIRTHFPVEKPRTFDSIGPSRQCVTSAVGYIASNTDVDTDETPALAPRRAAAEWALNSANQGNTMNKTLTVFTNTAHSCR
jgi:hypothetical protein